VERTARFVEPTQENFKTYSIEFVRLYLAIGSEVDVVAKLLCAKAGSTKKLERIDSYRPIILAKHPDFPQVEVNISRGELSLTPWKDWSKGLNPNWWRQYNNVKHERDKYFKEANLENTLDALGGLWVAIGYLYAEELRDHNLPQSQNFIRFSTKYWCGSGLGAKGSTVGFQLPGIAKSESLLRAEKAAGKAFPKCPPQ